MGQSKNQTLQTFQEKYEALAGVVHRAGSFAEAVRVVEEIAAHEGAQAAVLGLLPPDWREAIRQSAQAQGIRLVEIDNPVVQYPGDIDACAVGISRADWAIADTGSLIEIAENDASRLVSTLPRVHIALVETDKMLERLEQAAPIMREAFENNPQNCTITFISGPSRSGDIAMQLTLGVHGPQVSHVIVIDSESP